MHRTLLLLALLLLTPQLSLGEPPRRIVNAPAKRSLAGPVQDKTARQSLLRWGRTVNPQHPLRRQLGSAALLSAALDLVESNDLHRQPRHVRKALAKLAGAPQRLLIKKKTQLGLLQTLKGRLGDERFTALVGQRAAGIKLAAELLNQPPRQRDVADMNRGWGWQLLHRDDRAFSDPIYLTNLLRESGQTGTGDYIHAEPTQALQAFKAAWAKIAPANTKPEVFTLTGSDANNLLYDVARSVVGRGGRGKDGAKLLFFEDCFAGGRGKIADASFRNGSDSPVKDYAIVSPSTYTFQPRDRAELRRLEQLEQQALEQIAHKVKHAARPIGGLLVEPVVGARGAKVYRPAFMRKLRTLCDELEVPIIADEILTGGGRTGKFFAYQHYEGFEPDLITFGKGLQVSGIAQVKRTNGLRLVPCWSEMTTLKAYAEPLLKGAQVMNRIRRDKLMDNAPEVGAYLVRRLREQEVGTRTDHPKARSRGFGLLIYSDAPLDYRQTGISGAQGGRLMPYLTLSKAEVDQLLGTPRDHLTRLGAKALDLKLFYSDRADPKELPQDTYWQTSIEVATKQAQQYLDAPGSSPRLKRQAQATIERAPEFLPMLKEYSKTGFRREAAAD